MSRPSSPSLFPHLHPYPHPHCQPPLNPSLAAWLCSESTDEVAVQGGVPARGPSLPQCNCLGPPPSVELAPPIGVSTVVRARHGAPGASSADATASAPGWDKAFSLEPGELDFGAIIHLTPNLIDEIRHLEAQGGAVRIKFYFHTNNSSGNVIDVGGKEFRFTWSRELTDLCDIYEECQNGEDVDGLLAECGSAWRRLNVQ